MQLRSSQAAFADYLSSAPGLAVPASLESVIGGDARHIGSRLSIYKNNVLARLVDALKESFPAVHRLVGDEFFPYCALRFIAKEGLSRTSLVEYGREFPAFIAEFAPASTIGYLSDVARLEHLYLKAYHAAEASTGHIGSGAFALHPSAQLMSSPHQVSRIWELNRADTEFDHIELLPLREFLLIVRPFRLVEVRRVSIGTFAALVALDDGADHREARREALCAEPAIDFDRVFGALKAAGTFVLPQDSTTVGESK
ncbi:MAG: putative DNA-binding domain-containing protein [Alphaproteobacteria bacterium]|nr:putative DNA-binding domain-containing protein [Alphaproteobacteria bacterium]MBL6938290.1 putative DNA-binding domain-containing protein [Alphaproteobacteria bacterium]MBL7097346.1 putative DNA-binding domain-containing protein [Alphaproteobacteria bacterium]